MVTCNAGTFLVHAAISKLCPVNRCGYIRDMQQTADFVKATNHGRDHDMALKSKGKVPETEFLDL